jgi:hypothetical protein
MLYCRRCDVFAGFGAVGVVKPPADRADDYVWLSSHCWVCGRPDSECERI